MQEALPQYASCAVWIAYIWRIWHSYVMCAQCTWQMACNFMDRMDGTKFNEVSILLKVYYTIYVKCFNCHSYSCSTCTTVTVKTFHNISYGTSVLCLIHLPRCKEHSGRHLHNDVVQVVLRAMPIPVKPLKGILYWGMQLCRKQGVIWKCVYSQATIGHSRSNTSFHFLWLFKIDSRIFNYEFLELHLILHKFKNEFLLGPLNAYSFDDFYHDVIH